MGSGKGGAYAVLPLPYEGSETLSNLHVNHNLLLSGVSFSHEVTVQTTFGTLRTQKKEEVSTALNQAPTMHIGYLCSKLTAVKLPSKF